MLPRPKARPRGRSSQLRVTALTAPAMTSQPTTGATATSNKRRWKRRRASRAAGRTGAPPSPSGGPDRPGDRSSGRSGIGEPVADAVDRQQVAGPLGIGFQLAADVLDVRVHGPLV